MKESLRKERNERNIVLFLLLFFIFGLILNHKINVFLKEWIREPLDPIVFPNRKKNKYANPSGHAQFYSFLFFFFFFFLREGKEERRGIRYIRYLRFFLLFLTISLYIRTIYVCLTKGYHTPKQLLFGTFMGFIVCFFLYTCFQFIVGKIE